MNLIKRWWKDSSGATALEYTLIIAVLGMVIVGGIGTTFNAIQLLFEDNNSKLVQTIR